MIYSTVQFGFFRIILGLYLAIHFGLLIPYAIEIWSSEGCLPDPRILPTYGMFPNILNAIQNGIYVTVFIICLFILSFLLLIGIKRQFVSILLWYGWMCLFNRNPMILNPSAPYIGWLLLALALIPKGEAFSLIDKRNTNWEMPKIIFIGAWIIVGMSYTISGIDKLFSPSWVNGKALNYIMDIPFARNNWFNGLIKLLPDIILRLITWGALLSEILFLPLCILKNTRIIVWSLMSMMHIILLIIFDFADLSIAMLIMHLFLFDPEWFKRISKIFLRIEALFEMGSKTLKKSNNHHRN